MFADVMVCSVVFMDDRDVEFDLRAKIGLIKCLVGYQRDGDISRLAILKVPDKRIVLQMIDVLGPLGDGNINLDIGGIILLFVGGIGDLDDKRQGAAAFIIKVKRKRGHRDPAPT